MGWGGGGESAPFLTLSGKSRQEQALFSGEITEVGAQAKVSVHKAGAAPVQGTWGVCKSLP